MAEARLAVPYSVVYPRAMSPSRTLSTRWVIPHVVAAAALYLIDALYLGQGALAGLLTAIMVVTGLIHVVRGLFGDRARVTRGAVLIGLYAAMMLLVVLTIRASNREARVRADRVIAALQGYREARGTYPEHLAELVPEFLPAVPRAKDTFAFGEFTYTWHEDSGGFLMYTDIPPFGRPYYDLRSGTWKYMD